MQKFLLFISQSKEELKKVTWPSKKQTMNYTFIVISASIAVALFLGILDLGFSRMVERFIF